MFSSILDIMRKSTQFFVFLLLLFIIVPFGFAQTPKTYQFTNGNWYDGKSFKKRTIYAVNGILTSKKPTKIDETVDLKNQFVIPPLADAHTHNLDRTNFKELMNEYFREGVFYVQVLGNYASGAKKSRPFFNQPTSLDVAFANGGLTSTFGHPFMAYEPWAAGFYNPAEWDKNLESIKKSRVGENDAYFFFDSKADVDAKWEKFLESKPDLVKIFLVDTENLEKNRQRGKAGDRGLSPEIAEYVVQKAKKANLRVYAHVDTSFDFRLGLKLGVDGFAHLPNYGWNGRIEDKPKDDLTLADIKLAAKKKVWIIPTARIGEGEASNYDEKGNASLDQERFKRVLERQRNLYNLMIKNGVNFALGSDYFGKTLGVELWYLHDNKIFDNQTLLKLAVENSPKSIFPNRKIGEFKDGYEASFITVAENPLQNFETLKNINLRFKQGTFIELKK
jgi:imidazolonepropionase-like amidohydrolase